MNADRTVAWAQILLSIVFIAGYFFIFGKLLDGQVKTPPEWKDVLTALFSLLTAVVLMICQFWFSRSRPQETPP